MMRTPEVQTESWNTQESQGKESCKEKSQHLNISAFRECGTEGGRVSIAQRAKTS